jgi:hypothetical protein
VSAGIVSSPKLRVENKITLNQTYSIKEIAFLFQQQPFSKFCRFQKSGYKNAVDV